MIIPLLVAGFLLGMKHALEADHVAAVASLTSRSTSLRDNVRLATAWGLGHSGALFAIGAALILLGRSIPDPLARACEGAVGVMLIVLGANVLRRLRARRIHFHVHEHGDGRVHLHAHSHAEEDAPHEARHAHGHPSRIVPRAIAVGGLHGLAGSAALALVAAEKAGSALEAFFYLAVFGVGSVLGMALFSVAIAFPIRRSAERFGRLSVGLEGALGGATMALGCWILFALFRPVS